MLSNIFPIQIDFDEYQISRLQYSEDRLKSLRAEHNSTHSFFRNGDYIYLSNKEGDENSITGESYKVNVIDEFGITSSLIKHIFFRTFKERFPHIIPIDFYPFRIYSTQQKDDIIIDLLPESLKNVLCYKKLIEVQLRLLNPDDKQFFAFIINIDRNWTLNKSCLEMNQENFDLSGSEVLHSVLLPGLENILAPDEELIGIIKDVNGTSAKVETNLGVEVYPLNELFLKRSKFNITNYLTHITSEEKCNTILTQLEEKKKEFLNAKTNFDEITKMSKLFSTYKDENNLIQPFLYHNKDGFCFSISPSPYSSPNKHQLKTPTFIFDYAGNKTEDKYPDIGLNNYGPYDSYGFDNKRPNIKGICLKDNRGYFAQFLGALIDGLPNSRYFKKGIQKKYDLAGIDLQVIEVAGYSAEEFDKLVNSFEKKPDLIIIEIPKAFKDFKDHTKNPYYRLKVKFLSLEIPVQFIQAEKVKRFDEYLLNTIGLQIYAKLGGTPWVLPSSPSVDREIVVGIGHSLIRSNSYVGSEKNRVVGISTFFSSDGQYILSNKAKDVSFSYYFDELLINLKESFDRLKEEQAWKEGDTIRLIFHIFKPIRNIEYEVICELIKKYPQFKIQFSFVTIGKYHPFKLYDPNQSDLSKNKLGKYVPNRGSNIILDKSSCLVQMIGPREMRTERHGFSNPIYIRLRLPEGNSDKSEIEHLLFTDLAYIVQQIYSFTYLNWRGFLPQEKPATMLYSNLIAHLLGKLRKIEGWDSSVLNFSLKRKKWFL